MSRAAGCVSNPAEDAIAEIAAQKTLRYFPFAATQKIETPIKCDDEGSLLMMELPSATFQRMARSWNDVLLLSDRVGMMKLFVFLLQCACDCNAKVVLETVVNGQEFKGLDKGVLNDDTNVVGYRLWIPLESAHEVEYLVAVAGALASSAQKEMASVSTGNGKRRKTDDSQSGAFGPTVPSYLRKVTSVSELSQLVRLYYMGQSSVEVAMIADSTTVTMSDGLCPGTADTDAVKMVLTKLMDAPHQFAHSSFEARCKMHGVLDIQASLDSYLDTVPGSGTRAFFPHSYLREKGLVRVFDTGTDRSFIRTALDLFRFLLPQYSPKEDEIRTKLQLVLAARGMEMENLGEMSMRELVELGDRGEDYADAIFKDPHWFSPLTVPKDRDLSKCTSSFFTTAMNNQYFVIAGQRRRTMMRRKHSAEVGDDALVYRVFRETYRDMNMMLSVDMMDGVPPVYNDLREASEHLLSHMRNPSKTDTMTDRLSRAYFFKPPPTAEYRGLSAMLTRLLIGSRSNLGLIGPQSSIWLLLWLQSFSVTINRMGESFFGVLTGPPDTGKSRASEVFTTCVPPKLVMQVDGTSTLAMTVYGSKQDMRVVLMDELKHVTDKGGTGGNDVQTKLIQSQLSNGCITYNVKVRHPDTGEFVLQNTVVVLRNCTVTCTNFRHLLAGPLDSRAVKFAVASSKDTRQRSSLVSRNSQVATRDMHQSKVNFRSWQICLQAYSSLQWRYTAMEAIGIIPVMDDSLFVVFNFLMFHRFGDGVMTGRRIVALRKFVESIRIFDLISTWHTRGLGKKFGFDPAVEVMYYASASYFTAEAIVAGYSLLEQTTSTEAVLHKMVGLIKETIYMDEGSPLCHEEYYVSRFQNKGILVKHLSKMMQEQGEGMVEKMFSVAESGIAEDGLPNIKVEKHENTDKFMYHRAWIASVRTDTEKAILKVLRRLVDTKKRCGPSYDQEDTHVVFDMEVMVSLLEVENPRHPIKHPELARKTKSAITQAIAYLKDAEDDNGNPMFEQANGSVDVAVYVPPNSDRASNAVPSIARHGEFKIRKSHFVPLVVHRDLLKDQESTASVMDRFMTDFLSIAGGYTGTRKVFAGVNAAPSGPDSMPHHTLRVPTDHKVAVTIPNKFYKSAMCESMMLGAETMEMLEEDSADAADMALQNAIYPPDKPTITFTEDSGLEELVAERAVSRIAPGEKYAEAFRNASRDH